MVWNDSSQVRDPRLACVERLGDLLQSAFRLPGGLPFRAVTLRLAGTVEFLIERLLFGIAQGFTKFRPKRLACVCLISKLLELGDRGFGR